jgi:hypothetical protein
LGCTFLEREKARGEGEGGREEGEGGREEGEGGREGGRREGVVNVRQKGHKKDTLNRYCIACVLN